MKRSSVLVFVVTYALFLVSGLFFRIDPVYYNAIAKPSFTPPGAVIGIVWLVLFTLISLAVAMLADKVGFAKIGWPVWGVLAANWFFNQVYSYIQFVQKDWLLATFDAALVALTAWAFIALVWKKSRVSAWLFVPYAAWATFATYLTYAIWSLNAQA